MPLAYLPGEIKFEPEEMGMLLSFKADDVFNDVASFDEMHNSMIGSFKKLAEMRSGLTVELPSLMKGGVGTAFLNEEQMLRLGPRMAEVNSLVADLRPRIREYADEAWKSLVALQVLLKERVNLKYELQKGAHGGGVNPGS